MARGPVKAVSSGAGAAGTAGRIALFIRRGAGVRFAPPTHGTVGETRAEAKDGPARPSTLPRSGGLPARTEEAGNVPRSHRSGRSQHTPPGPRRKAATRFSRDLGGESILSTILTSFERGGVGDRVVMAGHDAHAVRLACAGRARCLLNPFFEHYGILGSVWLARPHLDGRAVRVHHRRPLLRPAALRGLPGRPAGGRRAGGRGAQGLRRRGHESVPQPLRQVADHDARRSCKARSSASSPAPSASAPRAAPSCSTRWRSTSGSTASRATWPTCSAPCTASGSWPFTSAPTTAASKSISPATSPVPVNSTPSTTAASRLTA